MNHFIACLCLNFPGFPNVLGITSGFVSLIFISSLSPRSPTFQVIILAKLSSALRTFQILSPKSEILLLLSDRPPRCLDIWLLFFQISARMSHYQKSLFDQFKQSSRSLCISIFVYNIMEIY